jgi:hypothetical protein
MKKIGRRAVFVGGLMLGGLGASGAAHATDIFVEAEAALVGDLDTDNRITSPLLIKDDAQASDGSYIEVLAGNDSKTTMPAVEGVAKLVFENPGSAATFTIWARVIAPTDGDDSFWLKMDNGSAIKWNGMPLGNTWHWVQVKADGVSTPAQFSLATGSHTLKVAYREDGTKLDAFIITSNSSFNPNATLTGPPAIPTLNGNSSAQSPAGFIMTWSDVPGASSYQLLDQNDNVVAALIGHVWTGSTSACIKVVAVGSAGSSAPSNMECKSPQGFVMRKSPSSTMSTSSPMLILSNGGLGTQSGTAESLAVVPASGRARLDFRIAGVNQVQFWAQISTPNLDNDSYWVRVDQGAWVKWNNIPNGTCSPVKNSDAGNAVMTYSLATGTHVIEFAYREIGAVMFNLTPVDANPEYAPCDD